MVPYCPDRVARGHKWKRPEGIAPAGAFGSGGDPEVSAP